MNFTNSGLRIHDTQSNSLIMLQLILTFMLAYLLVIHKIKPSRVENLDDGNEVSYLRICFQRA